MKFFEPQPAHLIYPFDGGWQVMSYVWANVFHRTDTTARSWFTWGKGWLAKTTMTDNIVLKYWYWCIYLGSLLAGAFQYVGAMLFVFIFVGLQFCLLVAWSAMGLVLMMILMIFNAAYASYYKIFVRCPACYAQMRIPIHVCPTCATEHSRLWPSVYGVFSHRCTKCDTRLPTLDLLGRSEIVKKCEACKRPMNKQVGRLINVHIPVIGGPSTGKSNLIFMATRELIESYARPRGYTIDFPDELDKMEYEKNLAEFDSGRPLAKTPDIAPQAYNLALKRPGERLGRIIYLYDAAGEAYIDKDNTILQRYYDYVDALIFVVDPFSIETFRREHESEIDTMKLALRPSTLAVMDAYGRMIEVLEQSVGLRPGSRFPHPIAVVVSKVDALGLDNRIGSSAAQRLMDNNPEIVIEGDAIDMLVEKFLFDYDLGNLVRSLRIQFEQVQFFACSALGRLPDSKTNMPFTPVNVLDPITWVLGQLAVSDSASERARLVDERHKVIANRKGGVLSATRFYFWDSLRPRER